MEQDSNSEVPASNAGPEPPKIQVGGVAEAANEKPVELEDVAQSLPASKRNKISPLGWAIALPTTLFFVWVFISVMTGGVEQSGAGWILVAGFPVIFMLLVYWVYIFFGHHTSPIKLPARKYSEYHWLYLTVFGLIAPWMFGLFIWLLIFSGTMKSAVNFGGYAGLAIIVLTAFIGGFLLLLYVPAILAGKIADYFAEKKHNNTNS